MTLVKYCLSVFLIVNIALASITAQPALHLPQIKFKQFKLENGLRLIVVEEHSAPVFSLALSYKLGSLDERPGQVGLVHLLEHMMFKGGSENVGPGELSSLMLRFGGSPNASTEQDHTLYFETLPANQVDMAMFLEADRMRSLEITKDNVESERNSVLEERSLKFENQAYGRTQTTLNYAAFENFAFKHLWESTRDDVKTATVDDLKKLYETYYAPNNAAIAVVGDVNTTDVLAKAKKYFGTIKPHSPPPPADLTESGQRKEIRLTLDDRLARSPLLNIAYRFPAGHTEDFNALSVLRRIFSNSPSSRLTRKLVTQEQVALKAETNYPEELIGPGLYTFSIYPQSGKDPVEIEKLLYAELDRMKTEPVTDAELQKARISLVRSSINFQQSSLLVAIVLANFTVLFDDPDYINTSADRFMAVTKEDIMRVARKYFTENNRIVLLTQPKAGAGSTE